MTFRRPLFYLAVAVAMVSSFATQARAQSVESVLACEQFNAAVAEKEGAFVVSGLQAEETVVVNQPENLPTPPATATDILVNEIQVVAFDTPQLTLPMGTLTQQGSSALGLLEGRDFIRRQNFTLVLGDTNGQSAEAIFGNAFSLRPNPALGNAYGFCLTAGFSNFSDDLVVSYFDGDTLIGQSSGPEYSFFAQPGETITRIDFFGLAIFDLQVAFCEDTPEPAPEPEVVPEPELTNQECLASIAAEVGDLADATTDSSQAYALNVASYALNFSAKDSFYQEDGNRLSRRGGNVFTGAAYAISYLEHAGVDGTDDLVDRILAKLEAIVDDEIDFAIANGGRPEFIDRAEDLADLAQWIDEDLDNPVVATIAYKLAWANAFFATY